MRRSVSFPDDVYAAAIADGVDVPAVCREAVCAALDGQAAGEHQAHEDTAAGEHEHPGMVRQLRALAAAVAVVGGSWCWPWSSHWPGTRTTGASEHEERQQDGAATRHECRSDPDCAQMWTIGQVRVRVIPGTA